MLKVRGVNVIPSTVDAVLLREPVTDYQARVYRDDSTGREEMEILVAGMAGTLSAALLSDLTEQLRAVVGLRATLLPHDKATIVDDTVVDVRKRKRWTDERAAVAYPSTSPR
jgi:phenylacetate-coenzyme A ligase PaaK-like adenylate-forming protein